MKQKFSFFVFTVFLSFFCTINASEFYSQLVKSNTLSSFLLCGRPYMNKTPRIYTDSFENNFDWIYRGKMVVIKNNEDPKFVWCKISEIQEMVKVLKNIRPKVIWLAGKDRPHLSQLDKKSLNALINSGAKIYYEPKDLELKNFYTAPLGYNTDYLERVHRSKIDEAVAHSESLFHEKKGVLAAWGHIWGGLDNSIQDRIDANKFALQAEFVDRRMIDKEYWWSELASYRFIISPLGNGIQTPKIFEALLVQTIPILINIQANRDLKEYGFPVVIVNRWDEITEEKLEIWWKELSPRLADARWMLTNKWWKDKVFSDANF